MDLSLNEIQTGWLDPKVCEVNLRNVEAPAWQVLGPVDGAWPAIEKAMDRATAVLSAYMAGGTQRVFEMSQEYSQTRIAFGVPMGTAGAGPCGRGNPGGCPELPHWVGGQDY